MLRLNLSILVVLTIALNTSNFAAGIIGGSLRYESLGSQKYKIVGILNRNCGDSALGIPTFKISSGTTSYTLSATRTSIKDITNYCSSSTSPCNPANTKTTEGQEQHVFETTIDFSKSPYNAFYNPGQCEVLFSMEACCRSSKITTTTANNLYLEAMLNLCVLGNSVENSNAGYNTFTYVKMCANLPYAYNFSLVDKDGTDSLFHSIEIPKKSKDSFERFLGLFSTQYPMTPFCLPTGTLNCKPLPGAKPPRGFYFDSYTGDIIVTPTVVGEGAVIDIRSSEFRMIDNNMTLIGYSTTELYIDVKACADNNPPTIPTTNKWAVCEGDKLCFTILSKDVKSTTQLSEDTTTLTWNFGIPSATFRIIDPTAREKSAEFCWQTAIGDASPVPYQFTAMAKDNNCNPSPLQTNKGFAVMVKPKANASRQYQKLSGNQLKFEGLTMDSLNYTYEWQIRDSMKNLPLYKSFKQKDSFSFKDTGRYFVTLIINNLPFNCPAIYTDTLYMNGTITTNISKSEVQTLKIYPNPTIGIITIELNKNRHYTKMQLINSIGQIIYTGPIDRSFDMSRFMKGIYMLEIFSMEGTEIATIIKE